MELPGNTDVHTSADPGKGRKLDRIDLKIFRALQDDARISHTDLAQAVGLSTPPCMDRVKRREQSGVIQGYQAILSAEALGLGLLVFIKITLSNQSAEAFDEFRKAVVRLATGSDQSSL